MVRFLKEFIIDEKDVEWNPMPWKGNYMKMLRMDESKGDYFFLYRMEKGASEPLHWHPQSEDIYIIKGWVQGEKYSLKKGQFVYYPPFRKHGPFTAKEDTFVVGKFDSPPVMILKDGTIMLVTGNKMVQGKVKL